MNTFTGIIDYIRDSTNIVYADFLLAIYQRRDQRRAFDTRENVRASDACFLCSPDALIDERVRVAHC